MAKLEKFREELGVISEEEFNQKVEEKVQLKSKLVGTIEKLQTAIKVFTALELAVPAEATAEVKSSETKDGGWWAAQ